MSLGLMLAGLVAVVALIYFALTSSGQSKAEQLAEELREEGRQGSFGLRQEYHLHLGDTNDRFEIF